jgi:hypothetical protein
VRRRGRRRIDEAKQQRRFPQRAEKPETILIEPGGNVQFRYRARRIGARTTKAPANEVPGDVRGSAIGKGKRIFGLGSVPFQIFGRK